MTLPRRTQDELVDAVRRCGKCSIFLGAGVSVTSGIPSAWGIIIALGRKLLGDERLAAEQVVSRLKAQPFYDHEQAYASVLDTAFPSENERVQYFENLLSGKRPTAAHRAVAKLVRRGYASVIVTTNFDRLMEYAVFEACRHMPCVLPSNSVPEYLNVASPRAKILKLHGDYLYGNIRNLDHELHQVKVSAAQKLKLAASEPTMIVAGYSGCDSSVMEVLKSLSEDPSNFPGGIYWLHLAGTIPENKEVTDLLIRTQGRGSGFVEITDSDHFFLRLQKSLARHTVPKIPPLPKDPDKAIINTAGRMRKFAAKRLSSLEAAEFLALIERRTELRPLARSDAGLDYLLARYEEQGELPGNVGELLDRYFDLRAGGSMPEGQKYERRVQVMHRLGLIWNEGGQWRTDFALLRHYMNALEIAESDLDLEKLPQMLADHEAYEVLRCCVGLLRDSTGVILAAVNAAVREAGIGGSSWTKSFYRAAALCGCGSQVDADLLELAADFLILELDADRWASIQESTRPEAVHVLSQMGSGVVDQLIDTVLLDSLNDVFSREYAGQALGLIGTRKVVDRLLQAGRKAAPRDTKMVIYALGTSGNPRAVEAIRELASNVDPAFDNVVQRALDALGYTGGEIMASGPPEGPAPRPTLMTKSGLLHQHAPEAVIGFRMPESRSLNALRLRELLKSFVPPDLEALTNIGTRLMDDGRLFEAEALLAECLHRYPALPGSYHNLAHVFERQGRNRTARRYYSVAFRLYPDYSSFYNDFAVVMSKLGNLEPARVLIMIGLGIDSADYRLWFNLAEVNLAAFGKADGPRKTVHMPGGGLIWVYEEEGLIGLEGERLYEAWICLRRVLELKPDHPVAGETLRRLGMPSDPPPTSQELSGVQQLGAWVRNEVSPAGDMPRGGPAVEAMERADVLWSQRAQGPNPKDVEETIAALREAHAICPTSVDIIHNIAGRLAYRKDYDAAIEIQTKALQIAPGNWKVLFYYGLYLQAAGRLREAIAAFQKVIRMNPTSPVGWFALAETYFVAGNISEARDTARHADQLSPILSWVRFKGVPLLSKLQLEPNVPGVAPRS